MDWGGFCGGGARRGKGERRDEPLFLGRETGGSYLFLHAATAAGQWGGA